MAVLDLVDGLTAEILINGEPAEEHNDPDEIQVEHENHLIKAYQIKHTVSKYIESESGQKFSIRMKVGRPLGHMKMAHAKLTMDAYVDGIMVWTLICDRPWFKKHPEGSEWVDILAGPKDGKGHGCTVREFSFLKIQTSSDITKTTLVKRHTERMKKKGTIVIKVYNSNAGKSGGPQVTVPRKDPRRDARKEGEVFLEKDEAVVSEKAVKGTAKSHAVALGRSKKTARGPVFRTEKTDGEDWPIAIFKFIYRDHESLQQMHVINREGSQSPPPSSAPSPRAASAVPATAADRTPMIPSMTPAQMLEMFTMWQAAQTGNASPVGPIRETKIKKEGERGVKRAASPVNDGRAVKKLKIDEAGVIHIDSDDEDENEDGEDDVFVRHKQDRGPVRTHKYLTS